MAVNVLARLDQGGIVILARDDVRRAVDVAILVDLVEAIGDHGNTQVELPLDAAMQRADFHII